MSLGETAANRYIAMRFAPYDFGIYDTVFNCREGLPLIKISRRTMTEAQVDADRMNIQYLAELQRRQAAKLAINLAYGKLAS